MKWNMRPGVVKNNFQISLQRHDKRCISPVPMIEPCVQLALECRVIYRWKFSFFVLSECMWKYSHWQSSCATNIHSHTHTHTIYTPIMAWAWKELTHSFHFVIRKYEHLNLLFVSPLIRVGSYYINFIIDIICSQCSSTLERSLNDAF